MLKDVFKATNDQDSDSYPGTAKGMVNNSDQPLLGVKKGKLPNQFIYCNFIYFIARLDGLLSIEFSMIFYSLLCDTHMLLSQYPPYRHPKGRNSISGDSRGRSF